MRFGTLILATLAIAKAYAGQCGKGIGSCGSGQCCSKYGWCGTDDKYCGTGCQEGFGECNSTRASSTTSSHPISTDGRCGAKFGNTSCPDGKCCSKYGWCGTSSSHCDAGCQSEFGVCYGASHPTSTNGKCGADNGNTSCPNNQCCSKYGWCGTDDQYCGTGCQAEFGAC
ncbi:carbohydrate-binding module family 18 protein, partial [Piromyces sp. E2]